MLPDTPASRSEHPLTPAAGTPVDAPRFLDLAGTIRVPVGRRDVTWDEVRRRTRSDRHGATLRESPAV
jgi:hypothetical protein